MTILPFTTEDIPALQELQPPGWDNITPIFHFYLDNNFCSPLKIVVDGKIVGTGVSILHDEVVWLAHIIVHPDFRNKGIGKYITQYLVDHIPNNCETIYLIATDMGEPVYKKIGFIAEADYSFFNKGNFGDDIISENIQPFKEGCLNEIISLDKEVYGENREMHFKSFLEGSFVFIENNKIEAFYLPKFGNGLIVAKNSVAGTALMKLRSKAFDYFILPSDNKTAIDCLLRHNYIHFRTAKRMRLGKQRIWQPYNVYNRVSGQIG